MEELEGTSLEDSVENDSSFDDNIICCNSSGHFSIRMPKKFPFLDGLDDEDKKEFLDIMKNKDLTKAKVQELEDEWADKQSDEVKELYKEFKENRTAHIAKMKDYIQSKIDSLPEFLKEAANKINSLLENQDISRSYERKELEDIYKDFSNDHKKIMEITFPIPIIRELSNMNKGIKISKPTYETSDEESSTEEQS
uniref:DUF148 domain-containing protein n=1 Tax=Parastrongyloides trichosuri TaxID=131310 RepID=A0A0N4ZLP9_PARTI